MRRVLVYGLLAAGGFAAWSVWKRREAERLRDLLTAPASAPASSPVEDSPLRFLELLYAEASGIVSTVINFAVNPKVKAFAEAIARAEGFYAPAKGGRDPLPRRTNNPGDLKNSSIAGVGYDQGKIIFSSVADGWRALYRQVELWLSGKSRVAGQNDTIYTLAVKYTGGDNAAAWASIVAKSLGVTPQTTLREYFG